MGWLLCSTPCSTLHHSKLEALDMSNNKIDADDDKLYETLARLALDLPSLTTISVGGVISKSGLIDKLCDVNAAAADHPKHRLCEMVAVL